MNLDFLQIQFEAFVAIMILITLLWLVSIWIKNTSIVDIFWGMTFVVAAFYYYFNTEGYEPRKLIVLFLATIWGLRLSIFLFIRNFGKGEDFRYQKFREDYGKERYWWFSFFQVFLLQGTLAAIISAPLLGAMFYSKVEYMNLIDFFALFVWLVGFIYESGSDWQLYLFKNNPANKGKLLTTGFWKYTRHPNYFGDSAVWWGFALFSIAGASYFPVLGALLMTLLILHVSGVSLLERTLKKEKPGYETYMKSTSAFIPWFKKKM